MHSNVAVYISDLLEQGVHIECPHMRFILRSLQIQCATIPSISTGLVCGRFLYAGFFCGMYTYLCMPIVAYQYQVLGGVIAIYVNYTGLG